MMKIYILGTETYLLQIINDPGNILYWKWIVEWFGKRMDSDTVSLIRFRLSVNETTCRSLVVDHNLWCHILVRLYSLCNIFSVGFIFDCEQNDHNFFNSNFFVFLGIRFENHGGSPTSHQKAIHFCPSLSDKLSLITKSPVIQKQEQRTGVLLLNQPRTMMHVDQKIWRKMSWSILTWTAVIILLPFWC